MIKVLEAYCKAKGYSGGTIWQVLEDCSALSETINRTIDPYMWGVREGMALRHGSFLGDYPIPINSWDSKDNQECTLAYIAGVEAGIMQAYTFTVEA